MVVYVVELFIPGELKTLVDIYADKSVAEERVSNYNKNREDDDDSLYSSREVTVKWNMY